jgi:hypothetical protein
LTTAVQADYEYDYLSDLLNREHRDAGNVDDWIERGNATVTASPSFENGIRLTAWAGEYNADDDHEFAIASAVYFFEIPSQAQYLEILVRYRGEPHEAELEDQEAIAGRIWIRNTKREYARRKYDDKHADETRYGDTFFLRAKRRSETIKIAEAGHVEDGFLEMHIAVEDGEQLDVESIDVLTYRRHRPPRVVQYYTRNYHWRPWNRYTYRYFYDGPSYYCTDLNYYIRWSYPLYDHHYLSIRYDYGNYLHRYYTHHPRYYYRSYSSHVNVRVHNTNPPVETRTRKLRQWTSNHENVRRAYTRSRLSRSAGTAENRRAKTSAADVRANVRTIIEDHGQASVSADRVQRSTVLSKRKPTFNDSMLRRRRQYVRSYRNSSGQREDSSQLSQKRKRYLPSSQYRTQDSYTRTNEERRQRLYNRSRVSPDTTSRSYSSGRQSSSPRTSRTTTGSTTKRKRSNTYSTSTSRSNTSTTRRAPPRTTTSSSNDDDDEEKKTRQSERSRNKQRTKRRK